MLSAREPLKIGVLLDSGVNDAWVFSILEAITASDFCTLSLAILNGAPSPALNLKQKMLNRLKRGLFNRYARWDRRRYRAVPDAFEPKDCAGLFAKAEVRIVTPIQKKFSDRFPESDVEYVRSLGLDVLIRFGFRIVKGSILEAARFGMWSYHHGDNAEYRGGPPLFWEIYERNPLSGCILQVLTEDLDAGLVLYRSWSATNFSSFYVNQNQGHWNSTRIMLRCLRDLYEGGWARLEESQDYGKSGAYVKPIYKVPNTLQMISFLVRLGGKAIRSKVEKLLGLEESLRWFVAYRRLREDGAWRILAAPEDRYFADPFLMQVSGRDFLFFENFDCKGNKGVISYVELLADGSATEPKLALERDYHLSYPFVFEHEGDRYMIPESLSSNRIELYKAASFPDRWELEHVLVDKIGAADSTLVEHGGKHWLFCSVMNQSRSGSEELYIFYSDCGPMGPWHPHRRNPVISDVRQARPAGSFFVQDGQLIRPSQDCSVRYGFGLNLCRVDSLTTTEYRETLLSKTTPEWLSKRNLATHTLNRNSGFEVRDGQMDLADLRRLEKSCSS
ncbi:MAG: hypothetical protein ABSD44_05540 [Terracidiphilus sp.]